MTWIANTCRYSAAHVYIGLAPGSEAVRLRAIFDPDELYCYKQTNIPITKRNGNPEQVALHLYAFRDQDSCLVQRDVGSPEVPGFQRVKLVFNPTHEPSRGLSQHQQGRHVESLNVPPVIAFLMTIGLSRTEEKRFFEHAVEEFLKHSWSSFPHLLREIGCIEPSTAA